MKPLRRSSTIFSRLVLAFIVVLLPIFIIMLSIIYSGMEDLRSKISESMFDRSANTLQALQVESERILKQLPEFVLDKDVLDLAINGKSLNDYEKVTLIKSIQRRLTLVKESSPLISEIKLFVPSIDRTITDKNFFTSIDHAEFDAMRSRNESKGSWMEWNGEMWIRFHYGGTAATGPLFLVSVQLSKSQLHKSLSTIYPTFDGQAIITNPEEGWCMECSNDDVEQIDWLKFYLQSKSESSGIESVSFNKERYMVAYQYSSLIGAHMAVYVPEQAVLGSMKKYEARLWMLLAASLLLIILFSYWIYRILHRPLKTLLISFRQNYQGHLNPIPMPTRNDEFTYLYQGYNSMVGRLDELIHEVYEQKIISQRHELKRLQSQINPHFLYNCLFVLNQLILAGDMEVAYRFSLSIGQYFQFMTRDGADEIPLELELVHSRTYAEIQETCFLGRVESHFPEEIPLSKDLIVPRLILQPVLENAYKYAFGKGQSGGELRIFADADEEFLRITVEDNGAALSDADITRLHERITSVLSHQEDVSGLQNVHRRIQLKFGMDSGLSFSRSSMGGLKVTLRFQWSSS